MQARNLLIVVGLRVPRFSLVEILWTFKNLFLIKKLSFPTCLLLLGLAAMTSAATKKVWNRPIKFCATCPLICRGERIRQTRWRTFSTGFGKVRRLCSWLVTRNSNETCRRSHRKSLFRAASIRWSKVSSRKKPTINHLVYFYTYCNKNNVKKHLRIQINIFGDIFDSFLTLQFGVELEL